MSQLSMRLRIRHFHRGQTLLRAGKEAESVFIIVSGAVDICSGPAGAHRVKWCRELSRVREVSQRRTFTDGELPPNFLHPTMVPSSAPAAQERPNVFERLSSSLALSRVTEGEVIGEAAAMTSMTESLSVREAKLRVVYAAEHGFSLGRIGK